MSAACVKHSRNKTCFPVRAALLFSIKALFRYHNVCMYVLDGEYLWVMSIKANIFKNNAKLKIKTLGK